MRKHTFLFSIPYFSFLIFLSFASLPLLSIVVLLTCTETILLGTLLAGNHSS
ncbi:MAG TPA: hypothetical protein VIH86_13355 [Puia sp.]